MTGQARDRRHPHARRQLRIGCGPGERCGRAWPRPPVLDAEFTHKQHGVDPHGRIDLRVAGLGYEPVNRGSRRLLQRRGLGQFFVEQHVPHPPPYPLNGLAVAVDRQLRQGDLLEKGLRGRVELTPLELLDVLLGLVCGFGLRPGGKPGLVLGQCARGGPEGHRGDDHKGVPQDDHDAAAARDAGNGRVPKHHLLLPRGGPDSKGFPLAGAPVPASVPAAGSRVIR